VAAVVFAGLVLALGRAYLVTPLYKAETTLIFERPLNVSNPFSGSYSDSMDRETELNSVPAIIVSPDVSANARKRLTADDIAVGYSVTAGPPEGAPGTATTTGTTVSVTATSPSASVAAHAADAYAAAFTEYREAQEQERVRQALRVIQKQVDSYRTTESRASAEYFTLLQRLNDLRILEATVTGNFRILAPATIPDGPFSPVPARDGVMGLVAGFVLGIGLALLMEHFDTRVRRQAEAAAIMDMPIIGTLPPLPTRALDTQPLAVLTDPQGPMAEAIRKVRSNLEFADVDGDLQSLVVTSTLQHEGKSLMVCNLALSMAAIGRRVVLVDGDLRRPRVHSYLHLTNGEGVSTVLTGRSDLRAASRFVPAGARASRLTDQSAPREVASGERLCVLTSGPVPPDPAELVSSRSFAAMIAELQQDCDLVIVDSPSILAVGDTAAIARSVDGLLFLVDLSRAKRPLLQEAARQIGQMPCRKLGLVVRGESIAPGYRHHYEYHAAGESPLDATAKRDNHRVRKIITRR